MTSHQITSRIHLQTHQQRGVHGKRGLDFIRYVKQGGMSNSCTRKSFARADDLWHCAGIQNSIITIRRAETQRQRLEAGTAVTFNRPVR